MKTEPLVVASQSTGPSTSAEQSKTVRCGGCGTEFSEATWLALALVQRVTCEDLQRILVRWPKGTYLEVRRCCHCGKNVATKEQA